MRSYVKLLFAMSGCCLIAACSESVDEPPLQATQPAEQSPANELMDGLRARSENRVPDGATAPSFVIDPNWPKPLPNDWLIGQVGGLHVDSEEHFLCQRIEGG